MNSIGKRMGCRIVAGEELPVKRSQFKGADSVEQKSPLFYVLAFHRDRPNCRDNSLHETFPII
jgi:hypothetical protein